ncbi:MAG TPA: hypothetical protein DEP01_08475 [Aminobacterium sp.]|uniref:ComF family protein n=2 Tax=Aminobacterium TaxID=81466 RepID=UPI000EC6FF4B|nr:hypothetical protein [Aminobacterium sp.]
MSYFTFMFHRIAQFIEHCFWPTECPMCGRIGSVGCVSCLQSLLCHPLQLAIGKDLQLFSGALHKDICRDMVLKLKYAGWGQLGISMGRALGKTFSRIPCCLVPIPLHKKSTRPWNQAALLARGIAQEWNVPVLYGLEWRRHVSAQTSGGSEARRSMASDAFVVTCPFPEAMPVILVDDVCTTGTTLRRGASALKRKGVKVPYAITWSTSLRFSR